MGLFKNLKTKIIKLPLWLKIVLPILLIGIIWFVISKIVSSQNQQPEYKTSKAEKGNIVSTISATGSITSGNNTNIYTSASGEVTTVYVKNGDTVKQGQKIAQIKLDQDGQKKQTTAWASYLSAKNSVTSAEQNKLSLANQLETSKRNLAAAEDAVDKINDKSRSDLEKDDINSNLTVSQRSLTIAQQKYDSADSAIAVAKAQLSSAWYSYQQSSNIIYAPASGILTNFALTKGMSVANLSSNSSSSNNDSSTQSVGIITNPSHQLTASVSLTEIDVTKVKPGQKVTLTMDAFADKTFTGEVLAINTSGQSSSGVTSYPTIIVLDNGLANMYPNMSVSANIIVDSKADVLTIPSAAVQSFNGNSVVKVIKDGKITENTVETGISDSTKIEIISGLNEGDEVVVSTSTNKTNNTKSAAGTSTSVFSGNGGGMGGAVRIINGVPR